MRNKEHFHNHICGHNPLFYSPSPLLGGAQPVIPPNLNSDVYEHNSLGSSGNLLLFSLSLKFERFITN